MAQLNNLTYVLGTDIDMLIGDPLKDHEKRLKATLLTLQEVKPKGDVATKTLLATMLERVERHISIIETHTRQRAAEILPRRAEEFNTGMACRHQICL
jgi:hypothetical protein